MIVAICFLIDPCCRLQAQGTPNHPYRYTSAWDVARKTYRADGVKGFYKGLGPTLFKVSEFTKKKKIVTNSLY